MKVSELLANVVVQKIHGSDEVIVTSIHQDSRDQNLAGGLYIAVSGTQVDGHDFIDEVIDKGIVAVVCERLPDEIALQASLSGRQAGNDEVTFIVVENSRKALGIIAANFYGNPTRHLTVIAVTGTNGKTSVVHYAGQVLQALGEKPLVLSTAGDMFDDRLIDIDRKAPSSLEVIELQRVAKTYLDKGATHLLIEATSQGLDQDRLVGVDIDVAIFTNLGQDHLDYHKTLEHYRDAKKLLFNDLKAEAYAVYNADDEQGSYMVSETRAKKVSVGSQNADYQVVLNRMDLEGLDLSIIGTLVKVPLIGAFNVSNVALVFASLVELAYDAATITQAITNLASVPGRMETVPNKEGILALVDYAHSPDALENVFTTITQLPHGNIITVVGCGGDRDRTKRAPMAALSQNYSTHSFFTADNPRTESLDQIFNDMREGIDQSIENFDFIPDRKRAIAQAVVFAQPGDVILVAGKGHEDYQIIGTEKRHFDDVEELTLALEKKS